MQPHPQIILEPQSNGLLGHADIAHVQVQGPETLHVSILGWIYCPFGMIDQLYIRVGSMWVKAFYGGNREDVAKVLVGFPCQKSGFHLRQDFPVALLRDIDFAQPIEFCAHTTDGSVFNGIFKSSYHLLAQGNSTKETTLPRQDFVSMAEMRFERFLANGKTITFPKTSNPAVTVIIPVHNQAALTFECLEALSTSTDLSFEVLVVDNASTDKTSVLLERTQNIRTLHFKENLHYIKGCNEGAKSANGRFLVFLNNDTKVFPDTLRYAMDALSEVTQVGVVGGKVLYPDLKIQECGSIIWKDGTTSGYGRGRSHDDPEFQFRRNVHYCSGSFLLTPKSLFNELGGFSEEFSPAYYEDADYCWRVHQKGLKVVYEPRAVLIHHQGASSGKSGMNSLCRKNKIIFASKHQHTLKNTTVAYNPTQEFKVRSYAAGNAKKILYIEDQVPHIIDGRGYPRSNAVLRNLVALGFEVTLYPMLKPCESWASAYKDIPLTVEIALNQGIPGLLEFILKRAATFDHVWVGRPHNMKALKPFIPLIKKLNPQMKFIFDSEAIFTVRDVERARFENKPLTQAEQNDLLKEEMDLYHEAHQILAVSQKDASIFRKYFQKPVHVLAHQYDLVQEKNDFASRKDFFTVGPLHIDSKPNLVSMNWFLNNVWPKIVSLLPQVQLHHYGLVSKEFLATSYPQVYFHGPQDSLESVYQDHRVFIAPTLFSGGIPQKVTEAAAHGVPCVITSLLAEQLEWEDGKEALVAKAPEEFAEKCARLYTDKNLWDSINKESAQFINLNYNKANTLGLVNQILTYHNM